MPKTKTQFWKLRIPGYVNLLNATAQKAGLVVSTMLSFDEQDKTQETVMSKWIGTEKQFRDTGLFTPGWRPPMRCGYINQGSRWLGGEITNNSGVLTLREWDHLPPSKQVINGVEHMPCKDGMTYFGSRQALIAAKLLSERQFPNPPRFTKEHRVGFYRRCEATDLGWAVKAYPGGMYSYWQQSVENRKAEIAEFEKGQEERRTPGEAISEKLASFASVDEFREFLAKVIWLTTHCALDSYKETKTREGFIYKITSETLEEFKDGVRELVQLIRDAPISAVRLDNRPAEERTRAADLVTGAATNRQLQAFLSGVLGQQRPSL